mgnify:CR=1 FL=1
MYTAATMITNMEKAIPAEITDAAHTTVNNFHKEKELSLET